MVSEAGVEGTAARRRGAEVVRVEVESSAVTLRIFDAPGLDPITVVLRDFRSGSGEMIVACYGLAWVGYWGAIGERTLREF